MGTFGAPDIANFNFFFSERERGVGAWKAGWGEAEEERENLKLGVESNTDLDLRVLRS